MGLDKGERCLPVESLVDGVALALQFGADQIADVNFVLNH